MAALDPTLVEAVKKLEGFDAVAFWDYQQWTNGYGTRAHYPHERISIGIAEQRLMTELAAAQASVDSLGIDMPPGVRKALTDLTFNAGFGWSHAGLGIAVRQKDWATAKEHLLEYDIAGGKVNATLEARRKEEASWFNEAPSPILVAAGVKKLEDPRVAELSPVASASPMLPAPPKQGIVPWS